jgi:hypothetical protein
MDTDAETLPELAHLGIVVQGEVQRRALLDPEARGGLLIEIVERA